MWRFLKEYCSTAYSFTYRASILSGQWQIYSPFQEKYERQHGRMNPKTAEVQKGSSRIQLPRVRLCLHLQPTHLCCQYKLYWVYHKGIKRQDKRCVDPLKLEEDSTEGKMLVSSGRLFPMTTLLLASITPAPASPSHQVASTLAIILAGMLPGVSPTLYSLAGACGCQCVTK